MGREMKKICKVCQRYFYVSKCREQTALYCSRNCQCQGQKHPRKTKIKKTCLFCHELFEVIPCRQAKKFCNHSCSRKYLWNQPKFRRNIINKSKGRHNSPKTEFKKGKHGNVKTEFKKGRHSSRKTEFKKGQKPTNGFTSKKLKQMWNDSKYREKTLKAIHEGRKLKPNIPEKFINRLLNKLLPKEYKFVGDGKVILGGFNPDFINVNGQKKIIEMYGCYWHKCPKCKFGNKRLLDVRRLKTYKKYGYKTLIIWQHELKDLNRVKNRILKFHDEI